MRYNYRKNFFDTLFYGIDSVLQSISSNLLKQDPRSFIDIVSTHGDFTIGMRDGSLVTVIAIDGSFSSMLGEEMIRTIGLLDSKFKGYLSEGLHKFSWCFQSDKDDLEDDLMRSFANSANSTLDRLDMSAAKEIVTEQVEALLQYGHIEQNYFVLTTKISGLSKAETTIKNKTRLKESKQAPYALHSQPLGRGVSSYINKHLSTIDEILADFSNCGLIARAVNCHDTLKYLRNCLDKNWAGNSDICLFGDDMSFNLPESQKYDYSHLGYPSISSQLLPRKIIPLTSNTAQIGDRIFAPITMKLSPRSPTTFNNLFDRLKKAGVPFRCKLDFDSDGLGILGMKSTLASILAMTQKDEEENKNILSVYRNAKAFVSNNDELVRFQMTFCTWAPANDPDLLLLRREKLASTIAGWGQSLPSEAEGDVAETLFSSIPTLTSGSVAPPSAMPLYNVIKMCPFARPGSLWQEGTSPYRSVDGKLSYYMPYSSKQEAWIGLFVGPMGSGKSVALASYNWALVLHPNCTELPLISIVDIGPSSKGFVNMIKQYLPKHKKHLAIYKRLKNIKEDCFNILDIPLGLRKPLSNNAVFQGNFISSLLITDSGNVAPEGSLGFINTLLKMAYEYCADRLTGYKYRPGVEPLVDQELKRLHFEPIKKRILWYDITDFLAMNGSTHFATLAQRHAVPTISTLVELCSDDRVIASAGDLRVDETKEAFSDFAKRRLTSSISQYPVLTGRTKLDLGEARIISLDLDEVAKGKGLEAERRTGLMYMAAYSILTKDFYTGIDHLEEMEGEVGIYNFDYRPYHKARFDTLARTPRRFCVEEKHRIKGQVIVEAQMDEAIAEGRKWSVDVCQASQVSTDFSKKSIELATNIFILGVGSEQNKKGLIDTFGLSETMQYHLSHTLRKPDKRGSTFLALFSIGGKWSEQVLIDTKGTKFLWNTNSSHNAKYVRDKIAETVGETLSRKILAELFPSGAIDGEVERRQIEQGSSALFDYNLEEDSLELLDDSKLAQISILEAIVQDCLLQAKYKRII